MVSKTYKYPKIASRIEILEGYLIDEGGVLVSNPDDADNFVYFNRQDRYTVTLNINVHDNNVRLAVGSSGASHSAFYLNQLEQILMTGVVR